MNEFKTDINRFLIDNSLYIALGIAGLILIVLLIIFILLIVNHKKVNKTINKFSNYDEIINCLGGIENIKEFSFRGSRFTVILINQSLLKTEDIKKYGISSVITMSNKNILVMDFAIDFSNYLNSIKEKA